MEDQFLDFVSKIGVMKPASIDEDKEKEVDRLNSLLLSEDYAAEEKIDGCHYLMFGCRFFSTEGVEKTDNYPHLRDFFMSQQFPNLILDGEINYPGKTSQYVTRATGAGADNSVAFQEENGFVHYTLWDILRTPRGTWLLNKPYHERRSILEQYYNRFIKGSSLEEYIKLVDRRTSGKKEFYEEIIASGREGVVLKQLDSPYFMNTKKKWVWMKIKQKDTADLFIVGYDDPKVKYTGTNFADWPYWRDVDGEMIPVTKYYYEGWIGALRLGAYVNGKVELVCTCSGMNEDIRRMLSEHKDANLNRVVKISYMEKTERGVPRHPRFEGFHESKLANECTWDLIQ